METLGSKCMLCTLGYNPILSKTNSLVYPLVLIVIRDPESDMGVANKILRMDLTQVGYRGKDYVITFAVKCATNKNQHPNSTEIECCSEILDQNIKYYKPKIILTLGSIAHTAVLAVKPKYKVVTTFEVSFINNHGKSHRKEFQEHLKHALDIAKEMNVQYVYILHCLRNDSYYVGMTNNIERRMAEHKKGTGSRYTRAMKPCSIVYHEKFYTRSDASLWENELKRFSKADKIKLVESSKTL